MHHRIRQLFIYYPNCPLPSFPDESCVPHSIISLSSLIPTNGTLFVSLVQANLHPSFLRLPCEIVILRRRHIIQVWHRDIVNVAIPSERLYWPSSNVQVNSKYFLTNFSSGCWKAWVSLPCVAAKLNAGCLNTGSLMWPNLDSNNTNDVGLACLKELLIKNTTICTDAHTSPNELQAERAGMIMLR